MIMRGFRKFLPKRAQVYSQKEEWSITAANPIKANKKRRPP